MDKETTFKELTEEENEELKKRVKESKKVKLKALKENKIILK